MQNRIDKKQHVPPLLWTALKMFIAASSIAVAVTGLNIAGSHDAPANDLQTEQVRCARFIKNVRITGDIRTFQPAIVFNDCRYWPLKIVKLAPEGSWVEKGDVVCQLDCSVLRDRLNAQNIQLIKANAGLATAEVRNSLRQLENAARLRNSSSRLALAREKLVAIEHGESINTLQQLADDVITKTEHVVIDSPHVLRRLANNQR